MRQVIGAILMAIGILVGGTSGLCVLILIYLGAAVTGSPGDMGGYILSLAIPMLVGAALFGTGLHVQRSGNDPDTR